MSGYHKTKDFYYRSIRVRRIFVQKKDYTIATELIRFKKIMVAVPLVEFLRRHRSYDVFVKNVKAYHAIYAGDRDTVKVHDITRAFTLENCKHKTQDYWAHLQRLYEEENESKRCS